MHPSFFIWIKQLGFPRCKLFWMQLHQNYPVCLIWVVHSSNLDRLREFLAGHRNCSSSQTYRCERSAMLYTAHRKCSKIKSTVFVVIPLTVSTDLKRCKASHFKANSSFFYQMDPFNCLNQLAHITKWNLIKSLMIFLEFKSKFIKIFIVRCAMTQPFVC